MHRDLHLKNVMIHFKTIVPDEEDLADPEKFLRQVMPRKIRKECMDMNDPEKFDIKLIDFGFAKTFDDKNAKKGISLTTDGFGALVAKPPEMTDKSIDAYDERIDVWYVGMVAMLLFSLNFELLWDNRKFW